MSEHDPLSADEIYDGGGANKEIAKIQKREEKPLETCNSLKPELSFPPSQIENGDSTSDGKVAQAANCSEGSEITFNEIHDKFTNPPTCTESESTEMNGDALMHLDQMLNENRDQFQDILDSTESSGEDDSAAILDPITTASTSASSLPSHEVNDQLESGSMSDLVGGRDMHLEHAIPLASPDQLPIMSHDQSPELSRNPLAELSHDQSTVASDSDREMSDLSLPNDPDESTSTKDKLSDDEHDVTTDARLDDQLPGEAHYEDSSDDVIQSKEDESHHDTTIHADSNGNETGVIDTFESDAVDPPSAKRQSGNEEVPQTEPVTNNQPTSSPEHVAGAESNGEHDAINEVIEQPMLTGGEKTTPQVIAAERSSQSSNGIQSETAFKPENNIERKLPANKGASKVSTEASDRLEKIISTKTAKASSEVLKASFNLKRPATPTTPKEIELTAQDVKDGLSYLRPTSKFLYQIGLSLLREVVYEGLSDHVEEQRKTGNPKYSQQQQQSLKNSLKQLKKDNKLLKLPQNKVCGFVYDGMPCGFRTESSLVLNQHMSEAHLGRADRLFCAQCDYSTFHERSFKNHTQEKHNIAGILVKPKAPFSCRQCFYETNSKIKYGSHRAICDKNFKLERNLRPDKLHLTPHGEDVFITNPAPVKLPRNPPITAATSKSTGTTLTTATVNGKQVKLIVPEGFTSTQYSSSLTTSPQTVSFRGIAPHGVRIPNPLPLANRSLMSQQIGPAAQPRPPGITQIGSGREEVLSCEICDGYIQGMQAYKVHMQWVHQINISHMRMPVFSCSSPICSKRFWSLQGYSRHSRNLKCQPAQRIPIIPDAPNRCFLCQKTLLKSLVEHILQHHLEKLKTMVENLTCLSMACRCKVFPNVDSLQQHMASQHKLQMTGLSGLNKTGSGNIKFQPFCSICKLKFNSSQEFARHCAANHVHKCNICGAQCSTEKSLAEHMDCTHYNRFCLACRHTVPRKKFLDHCLTIHNVKSAKVKLQRLPEEEYETYAKKPKVDWSNVDI